MLGDYFDEAVFGTEVRKKNQFQTRYNKFCHEDVCDFDATNDAREASWRFFSGESRTKGVWASVIRTENYCTWVLDTCGLGSLEGGVEVSFYRDVSLLTILNALSDRLLFVTKSQLTQSEISHFDKIARSSAIYAKRLEVITEGSLQLVGACKASDSVSWEICSKAEAPYAQGSELFGLPSGLCWRAKKQLAFVVQDLQSDLPKDQKPRDVGTINDWQAFLK